jgi:DNA-binding response OmpR family regulator
MLQAMRDDPATAGIPVVMITGRGLPSDRYFAEALGACAYFVKPFSPLELSDRIEALLATSASQ